MNAREHARIRLVISDVEGCLVPVGRGTWDLPALGLLARYVAGAREGGVPPLALCSGRPAQYVEAVAAALGAHLPAVCENGAVLYDPGDAAQVPLYQAGHVRLMAEVRRLLQEADPHGRWARLAEGKSLCVSVIARGPAGADDPAGLYGRVRGVLAAGPAGLWEELTVTYSPSAVDITPKGINKASGVAVLLERLGVDADGVLAIGDGGNDLAMLKQAGIAAAPANALAEVRAAADLVAGDRETRGVLEILRRLTGWDPA